MAVTRAITGKSVPILAWITGFSSSLIRQLGPEKLGGIGNLGPKIDEEVARTGGSPDEIGDKVRMFHELYKSCFIHGFYRYSERPMDL